MMADSPLQAAKDRLSIPAIWYLLNLPGKPSKSCRSPFREDRSASLSVYDQDRRWKDHATGDGGDVVDFLAQALSLSPEDACRKLIEMAGVLPHPNERANLGDFVRSSLNEGAEREAKRAEWPEFDEPTSAELEQVAKLRGLSVEGVSLAAERGFLWCAESREGPAWIVTDSRRVNAQARLLSGKPWAAGMKAKTLPGSEAAWPIGLREASSFSAIALVEGGPDLIAACHLAVVRDVAEHVATVAILGASNSIPAGALRHFARKRVRIFPHADDAGMDAGRRWARQLKQVGAAVDGFAFESGDLNDFAQTRRDEGIFSFVAVNGKESPVDMEEAQRIAGELVKLHHAGAIRGADDPEGAFFAHLIHKFGGTFGGIRTEAETAPLAA
jgi:hypothetical protein